MKKAGVALGSLGLLTFIGEKVSLANHILNPNPNVQAALNGMLAQYQIAYRDAYFDSLKNGRWDKLRDSVRKYLSAIGADDELKSIIDLKFHQNGALLP